MWDPKYEIDIAVYHVYPPMGYVTRNIGIAGPLKVHWFSLG